MTFIERASRVMTPIHIGASLGVAACLLLGSVTPVSARPAALDHSTQFVSSLDTRSCGCAVELAVAEAAR